MCMGETHHGFQRFTDPGKDMDFSSAVCCFEACSHSTAWTVPEFLATTGLGLLSAGIMWEPPHPASITFIC